MGMFSKGKFFGKIVRKAPSIIGSAIGMYLGGPAGAIAGGSIGGSMERGSENKFKGMVSGAKVGATYAVTAPMVGQFAGVSPTSPGFMSSITGANKASLLNQLGMSGAPGIGGGLGLFGNFGTSGILQSGGLFGGGAMGGLMEHAPALMTGLGAISGKGKAQNTPYSEEYSDRPIYDIGGSRTHEPSRPGNSALRHYNHLDPSFSAFAPAHGMAALGLLSGASKDKKKKSIHDEYASEMARPANLIPIRGLSGLAPVERRYAKGGYIEPASTGYVKQSDTGGQDDDITAFIPENSYVMNATDLSLLGDGSSQNGAKKIANFEQSVLRSNAANRAFKKGGSTESKSVKVRLSNDEYVLRPETVSTLGGGDNRKGAKKIDKMRMNIRRQKGVSKILPPKSKKIESYIY